MTRARDTRRMAETGTGSVRSTGSPVALAMRLTFEFLVILTGFLTLGTTLIMFGD